MSALSPSRDKGAKAEFVDALAPLRFLSRRSPHGMDDASCVSIHAGSVFLDNAGAPGFIVEVRIGRVLIARLLVAAVAERLVLGKSARADVERQFSSFCDLVGSVLVVSDESRHGMNPL